MFQYYRKGTWLKLKTSLISLKISNYYVLNNFKLLIAHITTLFLFTRIRWIWGIGFLIVISSVRFLSLLTLPSPNFPKWMDSYD